ncbi:MAG: aminotransferase class I/II-fold pyridoxal phosphate-dependent enzyme [Ignavibacteria bacterium]|jgi:methionine-gamma-lyase|nr:aminotransferase class I/II-fold pyridoxal phosphate-dependent enzyme [Ignavibacteria bacterium]
MENVRALHIDSQCVHAGTKDDTLYGSVVQPIYQTSTFKFRNAEQGAKRFIGEEEGYIYSRISNPTVEAMEDAVAALECGYKAIGCASGMAAVSTLFFATLKAGDHLICTASAYGTTVTLLLNIVPKYGIEVSFVNTHILDEVKAAIKPNTKMIFVESPCNPTMMISDIEEICKIAHSNGIKVGVDNTYNSPILMRPLEFGADYVIHSMTKYLNGHADVVAGIIVVKDEQDYPAVKTQMINFGGIIDPFSSFLVHRGIKTLRIRVEEQQRNAQKVAEYLEKHPKIEWVLYPGLKSHPQYELAQKQMKGSGSMIVFEVKGGIEGGKTLMDNTRLIQLAVSLGGVESLIEHPASMTHSLMGADARKAAGITDGLVRLAIGIEDVNDQIADLERGLSLIK